MATLTRTRVVEDDADIRRQHLNLNIPTPFPRLAHRDQDEFLAELAEEDAELDGVLPVHRPQDASEQVEGWREASNEITTSILDVQKSCLTALNDLLSTSADWRPILPDRRHSMPTPRSPVLQSGFSTLLESSASSSTASPIRTLVLNLRAHDTEHMSEGLASDLSDCSALVRELQARVERLAAHSLSPHDGAMARALVSLVAQFHRLSELHPRAGPPATGRVASWTASQSGPSVVADPLVNLQRQISDLQLERTVLSTGSPVLEVETALLWNRVDQDFDQILALCTEQQEAEASHLPPDYDEGEYEGPFASEADSLPMYEPGESKLGDSSKQQLRPSASTASLLTGVNEKMRMDLEAVALAIDRLYVVAPQIHSQRVELKKSKRDQMEKARMASPQENSKGKARAGKEKDAGELDSLLELIGKASGRRLVDQAVVLDGEKQARLERAKHSDNVKREAFVARLVRHSDAGRMHGQEAVLSGHDKSKMKDPEVMLSLPEFMREAVPAPIQLKMQMENPTALLTLPEFVKEPIPGSADSSPPPTVSHRRSLRSMRSRSLSAPPLAWLLASSSRNSSPGPGGESKKSKKSKRSRPGSSSGIVPPTPPLQAGLEVTYVAEYHETLQHILVFMNIAGVQPGVNVEAEVVPLSDLPVGDRGRLLLKCGWSTSPSLCLPAPVPPGVKEVKVSGQYYETKLPVVNAPPALSTDAIPALLDATQLSGLKPTNFICASCSLPLVQAGRVRNYRDLPSEHWAELVDAWMCHADQKLHDHVKKHSSEGFWPREGEALVGGSYLLLHESSIATANLWTANGDHKHEDGWRRVRCICGAIAGRCQERPSATDPSTVYRLAKYAVRPVSAGTEPSKIPLTAFIAEDMNEFVHAHATYRFVVLDEEEERPRILIWLFKPSMRLSYALSSTQYVLPKTGSIHAAKVLYKILDTATAYADLQTVLERYPGFPQAEHLYYPRGICRRLGAALKESTTAYPENMRTMTGLDVGWLQRV